MTSAEISARRDHWFRAVAYGFLAEALTVLTIIAVVMAFRYIFAREATDVESAAFAARTGEIVGIIGGTLYTFAFARLLMPRLTRRFVEQGFVVAVTAIAFSVTGSIAGHQGVPAGYIIASALKLGAGALAGLLYSRTISRNRNEV